MLDMSLSNQALDQYYSLRHVTSCYNTIYMTYMISLIMEKMFRDLSFLLALSTNIHGKFYWLTKMQLHFGQIRSIFVEFMIAGSWGNAENDPCSHLFVLVRLKSSVFSGVRTLVFILLNYCYSIKLF